MWQHGIPNTGTRIIAPYNDGSGAQLFIVIEDALGSPILLDHDGSEYGIDYLTNGESFGLWAYMPDGSKLWCELTSDEPIKLDF